jgi:hypothetical protein
VQAARSKRVYSRRDELNHPALGTGVRAPLRLYHVAYSPVDRGCSLPERPQIVLARLRGPHPIDVIRHQRGLVGGTPPEYGLQEDVRLGMLPNAPQEPAGLGPTSPQQERPRVTSPPLG